MISLRRQMLLKAVKLSDLMIMASCFAVATWAAFYPLEKITFSEFLAMRVKLQNFALFLGFLLLWHFLFVVFRLYHSRRLGTRWHEAVDVIKATSLGTLGIFMAGVLFRIEMITPTFLIVFWGVSSTATILTRILFRYAARHIRLRGRNLRYVLIVGTNERAVRFARNIEAKPELGYRLVGFVENGRSEKQDFEQTGYSVVTNFDEFPGFLRDHVVDEVMICLPVKSFYDEIGKIFRLCGKQGIIVRMLSDFFNLKSGRSQAEDWEGSPLITLYTGAMDGWPVVVKRGLDFVLSLVLLILLAPLFLITALLIKITSQGPVFFVQERVGRNKRRFRLYKFRTMVEDAEQKQVELEHLNDMSGPVFKIRNDPRITPVGRFLRRTSIDELPQLVNVLKGDMSLVGPRPLPLRDYERFGQDWHRRRFSVRPGMTCLWQVNGRSDTPFEKWMKLDMEYIDRWSLWLDLKILTKTIPAVLRASGAE